MLFYRYMVGRIRDLDQGCTDALRIDDIWNELDVTPTARDYMWTSVIVIFLITNPAVSQSKHIMELGN